VISIASSPFAVSVNVDAAGGADAYLGTGNGVWFCASAGKQLTQHASAMHAANHFGVIVFIAASPVQKTG
jgi:hypothetical protein